MRRVHIIYAAGIFVVGSLLWLSVWAAAGTPSSPWIGIWETADRWGSTYHIVIHDDGSAKSTYGEQPAGTWSERDGGVGVIWDDKGRDFLFNGVMGHQRLHTPPAHWGMQGFSSYMKKRDALPDDTSAQQQ